MCPKIVCGLINNISMQYDYLTSLVMSLCESVHDEVQHKIYGFSHRS